MFTGIVQGTANISRVDDHDGIRTFGIEFPEGFCQGLNIGASVAVDGVCLTVTEIVSPTRATFDVILQSLRVTTLGHHVSGQTVNVERAAMDGAEIGGHPLSGHVDFRAQILEVEETGGNCRMRFSHSKEWGQYIFPKGYIAINGCSLTLSDVDKKNDYFEIWLIPETRRVTTFNDKKAGDWVNIEIERGTQVVVDTIKDTLEEKLGALYPVLEALLEEKNINLTESLTSSVALLEDRGDLQDETGIVKAG
ncbi:riboflavin synthase subunit alpha [Endozoicomonas sp. 4G]|uniref:riboflavin synthase subunit alpha n=1 Tax=Endozoicomonas sp. 4G TaxID=2872754 RepID=UPI002078E639|nr:riboflavin synthase subunit alpha [Endozoicomonas sp. 4G]